MARDPEKVVEDTNGIQIKEIIVTNEQLIQHKLDMINQKLDLILSKDIKKE